MTHTPAKGQGQRSLGSKIEWKETDVQTKAIALPSECRGDAVGKFDRHSLAPLRHVASLHAMIRRLHHTG